jgi:hypothetical protein
MVMRKILPLFCVALMACAGVTDDSSGDEDLTTEGEEAANALTQRDVHEPNLSDDERAAVLERYSRLDPSHIVPKTLLEKAIVMFDANKTKLDNDGHLAVVDFSKHSGKKRFFVVDINTGAVSSYVVAHGSGSDPNNTGIPTRFSNTPNSNMSSLGYYVTAEVYDGKHGRSLRMDGVSNTNSNVRARAVVIHGASYVNEGSAKQGRSWGCFALPENEKDHVIDIMQGGALIYAGQSGTN